MQSSKSIDLTIPPELAGQRLDSALARLMPEHSRTRIKGWIEGGAVKLDRVACKPRDIVEAGSRVRVQMTLGEAAQPKYSQRRLHYGWSTKMRTVLVDRTNPLDWWASGGRESAALPCKCPAGALIPRSRAAGAGLIHRLDRIPAACWWCAAREAKPAQPGTRGPNHGPRNMLPYAWAHDRRRTIDEPSGRHPRRPVADAISRNPAGRPSRTIACWSASRSHY